MRCRARTRWKAPWRPQPARVAAFVVLEGVLIALELTGMWAAHAFARASKFARDCRAQAVSDEAVALRREAEALGSIAESRRLIHDAELKIAAFKAGMANARKVASVREATRLAKAQREFAAADNAGLSGHCGDVARSPRTSWRSPAIPRRPFPTCGCMWVTSGISGRQAGRALQALGALGKNGRS